MDEPEEILAYARVVKGLVVCCSTNSFKDHTVTRDLAYIEMQVAEGASLQAHGHFSEILFALPLTEEWVLIPTFDSLARQVDGIVEVLTVRNYIPGSDDYFASRIEGRLDRSPAGSPNSSGRNQVIYRFTRPAHELDFGGDGDREVVIGFEIETSFTKPGRCSGGFGKTTGAKLKRRLTDEFLAKHNLGEAGTFSVTYEC